MAAETTEETYALLCYSHSAKAWYLDSVGWSDEGTAGMQYVITESWRVETLLTILNAKREFFEIAVKMSAVEPTEQPASPEPVGVQTDPSYWR